MPYPVRLTGTMELTFLCECPGRPHDTHSEMVDFDSLSETGSNRIRVIDKTLIDKIGRARFKKISGREWVKGPTWSRV